MYQIYKVLYTMTPSRQGQWLRTSPIDTSQCLNTNISVQFHQLGKVKFRLLQNLDFSSKNILKEMIELLGFSI